VDGSTAAYGFTRRQPLRDVVAWTKGTLASTTMFGGRQTMTTELELVLDAAVKKEKALPIPG
jgi:hypothetical protein